MAKMKYVFLIAFASMSFIFSSVSHAQQSIAETWLNQIDTGQYSDAWQGVSSIIKRHTGEQQWMTLLLQSLSLPKSFHLRGFGANIKDLVSPEAKSFPKSPHFATPRS